MTTIARQPGKLCHLPASSSQFLLLIFLISVSFSVKKKLNVMFGLNLIEKSFEILRVDKNLFACKKCKPKHNKS